MKRHVIAIALIAIFSPAMWWLYRVLFPELSLYCIDLFLLYKQDDPQKSYWYLFYATHHLNNILAWWLIHEVHNITILKKCTKIMVIFQCLMAAEYWLFGGTIPYLPIAICSALLLKDVLIKK